MFWNTELGPLQDLVAVRVWTYLFLSDNFLSPSLESTSSVCFCNTTFLQRSSASLLSLGPCCIHFYRFKYKIHTEFFQILISRLSLRGSPSYGSSRSWCFTDTSNQNVQKGACHPPEFPAPICGGPINPAPQDRIREFLPLALIPASLFFLKIYILKFFVEV